MENKIAVIVGRTSGVGKKTAQDLIQKNYQIIIVGRNERKREEVVRQLKQLNSASNVTFLQEDLITKAAVSELPED